MKPHLIISGSPRYYILYIPVLRLTRIMAIYVRSLTLFRGILSLEGLMAKGRIIQSSLEKGTHKAYLTKTPLA